MQSYAASVSEYSCFDFCERIDTFVVEFLLNVVKEERKRMVPVVIPENDYRFFGITI